MLCAFCVNYMIGWMFTLVLTCATLFCAFFGIDYWKVMFLDWCFNFTSLYTSDLNRQKSRAVIFARFSLEYQYQSMGARIWDIYCCGDSPTAVPATKPLCLSVSSVLWWANRYVALKCPASVLIAVNIQKAWNQFLAWLSGYHAHLSYKLFHAVAITAFGNFLEMLSSKKEDFVVNESQGIVTNAICRYMSFLVFLFRSLYVFS